VHQIRLTLRLIDEPQVETPVAGPRRTVANLEVEAVGVLGGLGVPAAGVVPEGDLPDPLMPRQPGGQLRDRVEGREIEHGTGDGHIDVGLHHDPERRTAGPDRIADGFERRGEVEVVEDGLGFALEEALAAEEVGVGGHLLSMAGGMISGRGAWRETPRALCARRGAGRGLPGSRHEAPEAEA